MYCIINVDLFLSVSIPNTYLYLALHTHLFSIDLVFFHIKFVYVRGASASFPCYTRIEPFNMQTWDQKLSSFLDPVRPSVLVFCMVFKENYTKLGQVYT